MFHNNKDDNTNSTKSGILWVLFLALQTKNRSAARRIETHIKRMKSKIYIQHLKQYPKMQLKLIKKYSQSIGHWFAPINPDSYRECR